MAKIKFEYDYQESYPILTEEPVIGTTSLTPAWKPNSSPTNLNAVYISKTGSDAGADGAAGTGTSASPILTITKARTVINAQPARNTLIFKDSETYAAGTTVAGGDTTYAVQADGAHSPTLLIGPSSTKITQASNINFELVGFKKTDAVYLVIFESLTRAENCNFMILNCDFSAMVSGNEYFIFKRTSGTNVLNLCKFAGTGTYGRELSNDLNYDVFYFGSASGATWDVSKCWFKDLVIDNFIKGETGATYSFDECTFVNTTLNYPISSGSTLNITNTILKKSPIFRSRLTTTTYPVADLTRCLSDLTDIQRTIDNNNLLGYAALFFDEDGFDFRNQDNRLPSPYPKFYIQSPGVYTNFGAYYNIGGRQIQLDDANGTYSYQKSLIFDYPPQSIQLSYSPINSVEIHDINGNLRRYADDYKKIFTLDFSEYSNNINIWKSHELLKQNGSIRFYPYCDDNGTQESIFTDSISGIVQNIGEFKPTFGMGSMIIDHWKGWWFEVMGYSYPFLITGNTADTIYYTNPFGQPDPAADEIIYFKISFLLVKIRPEAINVNQDFFNHFICKGSWREDYSSQSALEFSKLTITLEEIDNDEPNF